MSDGFRRMPFTSKMDRLQSKVCCDKHFIPGRRLKDGAIITNPRGHQWKRACRDFAPCGGRSWDPRRLVAPNACATTGEKHVRRLWRGASLNARIPLTTVTYCRLRTICMLMHPLIPGPNPCFSSLTPLPRFARLVPQHIHWRSAHLPRFA